MQSKLYALLILISLYIMVPLITIYLFFFAITTKDVLMIILSIAYMILSLFMWLRTVEYSSKILNTIKIEEAQPHLTQLLSETTNRGVLINQLIIKTIYENHGISQTDLYRELPIPEELRPTKERVRQYAVVLEAEKLIKDMAPEVGEGKKRVYVLTKRGEWCVSAINQYYPTYFISYLVRGILRTRLRNKLPAFDSITD